MKTTQKILIITALSIILFANLSSALIINSVFVEPISPGKEGKIEIEVENIFDVDVKDVAILLDFKDTPFIPIGTSEQSTDEIKDNDEENFIFTLKASADSIPGDYEIPYTLEYEKDDETKIRTGTLGIRISANPDLTFSANAENAVQNKQGTITLRIVNKGFYDARFVSVKILPEGFTLLSENEIYIGSVDSDDFETATFDVIFNSLNTELSVVVEYKDFDNKLVIENVQIPIKVYSQTEALELGITKKSNLPFIISGVVFFILIWIFWRIVKKQRRLKKSMENSRERMEEKKIKGGK